MAPPRVLRRACLLLAAAALLGNAAAKLSVDGYLAGLPPGGSSYAPTFPSLLLASNGYSYTAGIVNTTQYAAVNTTGQARTRAERRRCLSAGSPRPLPAPPPPRLRLGRSQRKQRWQCWPGWRCAAR